MHEILSLPSFFLLPALASARRKKEAIFHFVSFPPERQCAGWSNTNLLFGLKQRFPNLLQEVCSLIQVQLHGWNRLHHRPQSTKHKAQNAEHRAEKREGKSILSSHIFEGGEGKIKKGCLSSRRRLPRFLC